MSEQMNEQLKPCPFCGNFDQIDFGCNTLHCDSCGASVRDENWDNRPLEDALLARAEAAEEKLANVGRVLSRRGCECGCDHGPSEHDVECSLCYGCEIDALLNGKEATDGL